MLDGEQVTRNVHFSSGLTQATISLTSNVDALGLLCIHPTGRQKDLVHIATVFDVVHNDMLLRLVQLAKLSNVQRQ
jgi:hypothetical protein